MSTVNYNNGHFPVLTCFRHISRMHLKCQSSVKNENWLYVHYTVLLFGNGRPFCYRSEVGVRVW